MLTYPECIPLSEEQIENYYTSGYIVAEGLVPPEVCDAVVEEANKFSYQAGGNWTPKIFDPKNPLQDVALHRLLIEPALVGATEQIFEAPARFYYGMLAVVPAHGGKGLEWHQDNMYDFVSGRALNTFVALCDITPDMAILWVAPGSQTRGVAASVITNGHHHAAEPENALQLPGLSKGDVCIFDRNTLHHSKRNTTHRHRYAYAAQFQEANARKVRLGGKKELEKPLIAELRRMWMEQGLVA